MASSAWLNLFLQMCIQGVCVCVCGPRTVSCHVGEVCVCVFVLWCPTVVSPVCSRKSWTPGTTIVTGPSPDADGFAFPHPIPASLRAPDTLWYLTQTRKRQPHLCYIHPRHSRKNPISWMYFVRKCPTCSRCVFLWGVHTLTHTTEHIHLLIAGLNAFFSCSSLSKLPLYCLSSLTAQSGLTFLIDNHNRHLSPSPPLHPHFNPLPAFLFCSEWRPKAAVSASFPSLIALLAGGGTRSFSDTDGEGGGSIKGGGNGWLVFVVVTFPSHLFSGLFAWTVTPQADTDTLLTLMPVKAT